MPEKLKNSSDELATTYAGSNKHGVWQFSSNRGFIIGIEGADLQKFIFKLGKEIEKGPPAKMLDPGIKELMIKKRYGFA